MNAAYEGDAEAPTSIAPAKASAPTQRHLFERPPEATDTGELEQLLPWNVDRTQIPSSALGDVP